MDWAKLYCSCLVPSSRVVLRCCLTWLALAPSDKTHALATKSPAALGHVGKRADARECNPASCLPPGESAQTSSSFRTQNSRDQKCKKAHFQHAVPTKRTNPSSTSSGSNRLTIVSIQDIPHSQGQMSSKMWPADPLPPPTSVSEIGLMAQYKLNLTIPRQKYCAPSRLSPGWGDQSLLYRSITPLSLAANMRLIRALADRSALDPATFNQGRIYMQITFGQRPECNGD